MDPQYNEYLSSISEDGKIANDHEYGSECLKVLIQREYLKYSDITVNPEKFFEAHKNISNYRNLEGFSVKFTVQFNLFAGSILTLGTSLQQQKLLSLQETGDLGCFMLTEYSAGVQSGMIVKTRADIINDHIIINTPDIIYDKNNNIIFEQTLNRKNWISQGLTAKYGVCIASLYNSKTFLGIYPFLIDMSDPCIHKKDNGSKTGINGLDNSQIIFTNLKIKRDQIMYDDLDGLIKNSKNKTKQGFIRIASRLNSGRLCIADSLLSLVTQLVKTTKEGPLSKEIYIDSKKQIKNLERKEISDLIYNIEYKLDTLRYFVDTIKKEYCDQIKQGKYTIDNELIDKIMVAKILVIDYGLNVVHTLRRKIGANSLFLENNLGSNLDILLCGRFAEGDNDILMMKLVTDRIQKQLQNNKMVNFLKITILPITNPYDEEEYLLLKLASVLAPLKNKSLGLSENYKLVNICGKLICCNILSQILSQSQYDLNIQDINSML